MSFRIEAQNVSLNGVNIYVLNKTPRDCTAPPHLVVVTEMYSPLMPLVDSIQMANKNKKVVFKKKQKKKISTGKLNRQLASLSLAKPGYAPGLLGDVGGAAGAWLGPGFSKLGRKAGDWLGKITGMGDYEVNDNTLLSNSGPPMFQSNLNGSIEICKREFITDISGSVDFMNGLQIPINPGLFSSFPFLSSLAANFEQYELLGMVFEFKSTSANALNSTNTALGTVIMATNYDTLDPIFVNKQQMEAYEFANSTAPSQSMLHPIECDPRLNALARQYVRTGAVPVGGDPRFYDLGLFQLATSGMQASSVIGELWVSYHVRLHKPKLPTPTASNVLVANAILLPDNSGAFNFKRFDYNNLGITVQADGITIPYPGEYYYQYTIITTTSFTRASSLTYTNGAEGVQRAADSGWNSNSSLSFGNGTTFYTEFGTVRCSKGFRIRANPPTIVGTVTGASIQVYTIPGDFH